MFRVIQRIVNWKGVYAVSSGVKTKFTDCIIANNGPWEIEVNGKQKIIKYQSVIFGYLSVTDIEHLSSLRTIIDDVLNKMKEKEGLKCSE